MLSITSSLNTLEPIKQIQPIDFSRANSTEIYSAYVNPVETLYRDYISKMSYYAHEDDYPGRASRIHQLEEEAREFFCIISNSMYSHFSGWEKINAFAHSIFGGPQMIEQLPEVDYKIFSLAEQSGFSKFHESMTHHVMKSYNNQNQLFFVIKQKYISGSIDTWPMDEDGFIMDFVCKNTYDTRIILLKPDQFGWRLEYYNPTPTNLDKSIRFIDTRGLICNQNYFYSNDGFYVHNDINIVHNYVRYHILMTILNNYLPKEISDLTLVYENYYSLTLN